MSNNLADIAGEEYEWLVEVKKSYDRRHLLEMQLKLDDSEGDQAIWEEIYLIDEDIEQLIDSDQKEDWMDEWEKCTPEFVMKKFHRTRAWEDLKIGFSRGNIYLIRCIHPIWGKEFHAKNDFRVIPLIKTVGNDEFTTEPYDILRHIAQKKQFSQKKIGYKSAMSRANKLLKDFFKLDSNPITCEHILMSDDSPRVYTSKIDFFYLD